MKKSSEHVSKQTKRVRHFGIIIYLRVRSVIEGKREFDIYVDTYASTEVGGRKFNISEQPKK
jgi:hypothetical protein